jgi:uncharacterized membrane protein YbaN (DUF454 family)
VGGKEAGFGTTRRSVYVALGAVLVGVGALGVFLPGLPTTVFLLAASYFFARSSPSLHRKLNEHPRLGPYLRQARGRTMTLKAKVISLVSMWVGIGLSCLMLAGNGGPIAQLAVVGLGLVGTAVLIFYIKTVPAEKAVPAPVSTRRR